MMGTRMNWDWVRHNGRTVTPVVVYTTFVSNGTYRIAYSLDVNETSPIKAYASDTVGMVYNCKSHDEAYQRVFDKVKKSILAKLIVESPIKPTTLGIDFVYFDRRKLESNIT